MTNLPLTRRRQFLRSEGHPRVLAMFSNPGDEGLILDSVLAGEAHCTDAAAVKRIEQRLTLGRGIAESAIATGADDRGVGGDKIGWHRLHTPIGMLFMMPRA